MAYKSHQGAQEPEMKNLSFTLWRLQREYDQRHRHDVNRVLSERPRTRSESLN